MSPSQKELDAILQIAGTDFRCAQPSELGATEWEHGLYSSGRDRVWRVSLDGSQCVLRRYAPYETLGDIEWVHTYLRELSSTGFPAPEPVAAFSGSSLIEHGGSLWGAVSFIPGRPLLWDPGPSQLEVGSFLARYHACARKVSLALARPSPIPVSELTRQAEPHGIRAALGGEPGLERYGEALELLEHDLARIGHHEAGKVVIHGDPTNDNIVVDDQGAHIKGLIDFDKAYLEVPLADLAFGLWRSGRTHPGAIELDPDRIGSAITGYSSSAGHPVDPQTILIYIRARGLQLIQRWIRRGVMDCRETLRRILWVSEHADRICERIKT